MSDTTLPLEPEVSPPPASAAMSASANRNRAFWSFASFASSYGFRLASNMVLTRLLAPEIFGVMVVVHAMRLGIELLTDIGIEQNIVRHKDGLESRFFNTAWTMQIIRGSALSILVLLLAPLLGSAYGIDRNIFLVMALAPLINSLHSTAIFALVKNLEVKKRTLFELRAEMTGFVAAVTLAVISPTVWALVFGVLIQIATRTIFSYFLPHPPHKLMLDRACAREILLFGRWIMISSLVMFAAGNLDRLILGGIAPFALLGIYGLARSVADIPAMMARRLTYQLIFPLLAKHRQDGAAHLPARVHGDRLKLVLVAAVCIAGAAAGADWAIGILYDRRYDQAGWMLSLLLFGTWISILSNLNEGFLIASGKPSYESAANVVRFAVVAAGLWFGYTVAGFAGAIAALIASEAGRYLVVSFGQVRVGVSYLRQDLLATCAMGAAFALLLSGRIALGLGTPWSQFVMPR